MKKLIFFLFVIAVFLFGCQKIVCDKPYMQVGKDCCFDGNGNGVCDVDDQKEEQAQPEPSVIEKEIEVKKFVCSDGSIVDDSSKCPIQESKPAEQEKQAAIPGLKLTNEKNTAIEKVTVEPACVNGLNGGKIYFKLGSVPSDIIVQVKEGSSYTDVYKRTGIYEQYIYFAICDKCRGSQVDFKLKPGKNYVMRLMFNQTKLFNRLDYSNEHLVDTNENSDYMTALCGN